MKEIALCELVLIGVILYYFYHHPKIETVTVVTPPEVHWITNSVVCVEPIGVEVKVPVLVATPVPTPPPTPPPPPKPAPAPFVPGAMNDPVR